MKWATVFQQVAARPDAVAEIARLNGTTAAEILSQVELQTSCAGSNYDLARKAKDALARHAQKSTAEADQAEREASRRSEEAKKLQEVRERITEEVKERAKKAAEDQVEREKAQREQAQHTQAQRATVQPGTQTTGHRASSAAPQGKKPQSGCSRWLKLALGAAGLIAVLLVVWAARKAAGPGGGGNTGPGVTSTCAPLVTERRKCPWTPEGFAVEPCGPGFCWDGGPQGSLACKQEVGVDNSHQNDLSVLVCNDGYYPERDPCTNVILRCVKQ